MATPGQQGTPARVDVPFETNGTGQLQLNFGVVHNAVSEDEGTPTTVPVEPGNDEAKRSGWNEVAAVPPDALHDLYLRWRAGLISSRLSAGRGVRLSSRPCRRST